MSDSPAALIVDADGNPVDVILDEGIYRLAMYGKVTEAPPPPPAGSTVVQLIADTPLEISGTEDSEYTIPDGVLFHLTQVVAGAAGDPTERGSAVELFFTPDDGTTLKIVQRVYVAGFTTAARYEPVTEARDGTPLLGDATGNTKLILRRRRLSGSAQEVDAVVQGYVI